jgi:hypothetical protein
MGGGCFKTEVYRGKGIEKLIFPFWAHFRRFAPETGLSAPIPRQKGAPF